MNLTKITSDKQKAKAIAENKKVLTASELAVQKPHLYNKKMQEMKANEGIKTNKHNDSVCKVFYHVDTLLSLMDDLLDEGVFVQNLKAKAKLFLKELESYNTKMYSVSEKSQAQVMEVITEQEQLFDLITNTHNIYYQDLFEILTEYNKTRNKDEVIKSILASQYALFKDFEIPEIVRKQVLRIEKNADSFTVLHLAEVVTREKVLNLPKLNPKTLDVLDKMFKNAQIKW